MGWIGKLKSKWRQFKYYYLKRKFWYKIERIWVRPKLCVICNQRKGKYYYGMHEFPIQGKGKYVPVKGMQNTVRWIGETQKLAYWECEVCHHRINNGDIISQDETSIGYGIAGV